MTLNRSGLCVHHEPDEDRNAQFLMMCDEALEALEIPEIPVKIPEKIPEIPVKIPKVPEKMPDEPIAKEIPVDDVRIHNLSGLMKQINILIVLCFIVL
eukprot:2376939-Prymnesium_polylepis.1